jgi:uncharacterized protein
MKQDFNARHLNLVAFAQAGGQLVGEECMDQFERLLNETHGLSAEKTPVHFSARGEVRHDASAVEQVWMQLSAQTILPMTCQRCLELADIAVEFERAFRFVGNESQAALEDESCDEDVLVLSRAFNLLELVEDELLLALPIAPMHLVCPQAVKLQLADADFEDLSAEKPNPFAVLQQLKNIESS